MVHFFVKFTIILHFQQLKHCIVKHINQLWKVFAMTSINFQAMQTKKYSFCQKLFVLWGWSLFKMIWQKIKWNMSRAIFTLGVRKRSEEQSYHRKLSIFRMLRPLMVNDIHRNTCYYAKKQLFGTTHSHYVQRSLLCFYKGKSINTVF